MDKKQFMALWHQGKPLNGYFDDVDDRMKSLRGKLLTNGISEAVRQAVTGLTDEVQVLAFSEPWCPDCVINLTVLEMMAECSPRLTVKAVGRDGHERLITSFNAEGKAYIPTFLIFVNDKLTGTFVEQPERLKQRILEGSQADRITAMQAYRAGQYADATAEELAACFQMGGER